VDYSSTNLIKGIIMQETSQRRVPARQRKLSLECKLGAYAFATGALLATPDPAPAEIIYSGVVDVPVGLNTSYNLDLNGDGTTDFTIVNSYDSGFGSTCSSTSLVVPDNNAVVITPPDAAALNPFDVISANDQLGGGRRLMAALSTSQMGSVGTIRRVYGPWIDAQNKFLGLRFVFPDGSTHYGWARMSVGYQGNGFDPVIHDWAYENTPDMPILAGDTIGGGPAPAPAARPHSPAAPEPSPLALLAQGTAGVETHLRNQPCPSALPGNSSWSVGMPPTGK
jgi:hypothetical protein